MEKEVFDFTLFVLAVFIGGVLIGCLVATNAIINFKNRHVPLLGRPNKKSAKSNKTCSDNGFDN